MQTVIDEEKNEYRLIFRGRSELEFFLWQNSSMLLKYDLPRSFDENTRGVFQRTVQMKIVDDNAIEFTFAENGCIRSAQVVPIEILKSYNKIAKAALFFSQAKLRE